jgi:hypothetical protein
MVQVIRKSYRGKAEFTHACAVCGKEHGVTYSFKATLRGHGIKGEYASPACIRRLAQQAEDDRLLSDD